jgi:hypothetical protein
MSVCLSLHYYCWRKTLIAHTFRERLMIGTIIVHLVANLGNRDAVLAFLVRLVLSFTLCFHFRQEVFKALMLKLLSIKTSEAVNAFLIRSMCTCRFYIFQRLLCHSKTVNTFAIRTVSAMGPLNFLLSLDLGLSLGELRTLRRSVNHLSVTSSGLLRGSSVSLLLLGFWLSARYYIRSELSIWVPDMDHITIPRLTIKAFNSTSVSTAAGSRYLFLGASWSACHPRKAAKVKAQYLIFFATKCL